MLVAVGSILDGVSYLKSNYNSFFPNRNGKKDELNLEPVTFLAIKNVSPVSIAVRQVLRFCLKLFNKRNGKRNRLIIIDVIFKFRHIFVF